MSTSKPTAGLMKAALIAAVLSVAAPGAWALEKCQAKIKKKDGAVMVNAMGVTGTLNWGWDPAMAVFGFDNGASCLGGGAATACTLAPAGDPLRITPPPMCTVHLEDDTGTCQAYIAGCVPAARPICPPDMEQVGSWCIDRVGMSPAVEFGQAVAACQARGRSLCPLEALIECDQNRGASPATSCAGYTDGAVGDWIWTITPAALDNQNFFTFMTVYQDNNVANVQPTTVGSLYSAFCCQRLGGN